MRSTWQLNLEAFRFYRLKADKFVKFSLLLILGLQLLARIVPLGDRNFFPFTYALESLGRLSPEEVIGQLSPGNWLIIGLHTLSLLLASILSVIYMQIFVLEQTSYAAWGHKRPEDQELQESIQAFRMQIKVLRSLTQNLGKEWQSQRTGDASAMDSGYFWEEPIPATSLGQDAGVREELPADQGWEREDPQQETALAYTVRRFGQTWPRQLLFLLILDLAYGSSVLLLGLPFYFYLSAYLFAPILFMQGLRFGPAMRQSYAETKGLKLFIISNYFMVNLVFLLAEGLISMIFQEASYGLGIWQSLLFALRFLVFARFAALMYLVIREARPEDDLAMSKL